MDVILNQTTAQNYWSILSQNQQHY